MHKMLNEPTVNAIDRMTSQTSTAPTRKKYEVTVYKPVSDVLRGFIEIDAASAEEAAEEAMNRLDDIDFEFWQCGDNPEPITAEASEIVDQPQCEAPHPLVESCGVFREWGMKCPKCGHDDQIDIAAHLDIRLTADGTDADASSNGDHEWGSDDPCACNSCGFAATVKDFEDQP